MKIYYALIIFSFSQKRNLLKITNSALKEKNEKKNEKNEKDEKKEKNNEKKNY